MINLGPISLDQVTARTKIVFRIVVHILENIKYLNILRMRSVNTIF